MARAEKGDRPTTVVERAMESGWLLDADAKAEIDRILRAEIPDPVGSEFMAPLARS